MKNDVQSSGLVPDGRQRLLAAIRIEERTVVQQQYADQWQAAGIWRRWLLKRQMDREVEARLAARAEEAPSEALY